MISVIYVGVGGCLGAISRYLLSGTVNNAFGSNLNFPLATLTINVLGSFFIGILMPMLDLDIGFSESQKLFLVTGFLGGFTTFSAFSLETVVLIKEGNITIALLSVAAQLIFGFGAVLLGYMLGKTILS